ncbi:dephospho-CoA kinase [Limnohabitans sp.]|uniref:dephospho-CoA kinase n=1 Tax=Limnohabitans sp. TaxID=1907725 RepID=UPI00286F70FA|nr:dephospho-CoA kinase [Limnohabitans sp.]
MNARTHANNTLRIGLTGGIGSGKSTVATLLVKCGCALVDADAIARHVTAASGTAMTAIAANFGADFVLPNGALDRDRMRAHVFNHPSAKQRLEAIIHPLVAIETERQAQAAVEAGHWTIVFDVPLLVESDRWRTQVDRVLVVDCLVETQIQRVMARNNFLEETVKNIIAAQARRAQRLAAADWVIYNDKLSLQALDKLVSTLSIRSR